MSQPAPTRISAIVRFAPRVPPASNALEARVVVPGGHAKFLPALGRARLERFAADMGAHDPEAYATELAARIFEIAAAARPLVTTEQGAAPED